MTELFNGGELDAFVPSNSACVESTLAGRFDPTFARCAIMVGTNGAGISSYIETTTWSAQTSGWLHFDMYPETAISTGFTHVSLLNGSGTEIIRIYQTISGGDNLYNLQYLDSMAAWQSLGTVTSQQGLDTWDIYWDIQASGSVDVYIAGTLRIEGSADLSHLTGVVKARFREAYKQTFFSQVMADTESTVGKRLYTIPPTGTGSTSAWSGTYANIDEITYSDADTIYTGTANNVSTFAVTPTIPTGYVVESVTVSARGKYDGSGPANLQLALRSNSTNYFSGSKALTVGYVPYQYIWETDPATSAAWLNTAITSLQPGVKAIT